MEIYVAKKITWPKIQRPKVRPAGTTENAQIHELFRCFRTITGDLDDVFRAVFDLSTGCAIDSFELYEIEVTTTLVELLREKMVEIPTLSVVLDNSACPNGGLEPLIEVSF